MSSKVKIIRSCTVPQSLGFVSGMIPDLIKKYEVVLLSSPGDGWENQNIKEHIDNGEVKAIKVPMARHISLINDVKSLWHLWRVFLKEKPTMVHSMTPKAGMLCMLAAWGARVPVRIHTFTGLVFPTSVGLKRKILMATDWLTCACATHIIPEGEGVKNDLTNFHITQKPLKVLGYGNVRGVDLTRFDRNAEVLREADALRKSDVFTFIFVGRIVRDKGINELVEAFARLHKENSNTRLLLVGPYEDNLDPVSEVTRKTIDTNEAIEAVGSQKDVRSWYAASDALVFPSYREGFPNVVIEAGAMGLPSIVTDINGSREIISDGVNGAIIPSKDADALYTAMKQFVTDANRTQSMSAKAREMIASRYEQGFVRQCLYDYYDEVLKSK